MWLANQNSRIGLLPLSADPITLGHIDLINKAALQCDSLVVAVMFNDEKIGSYLFGLKKRVSLARSSIQHLCPEANKITILGWNGLLVDLFLQQGCSLLFRGIRGVKDYEYEKRQMQYQELIEPGMADVASYITADPALKEISSTSVKLFARHHISVAHMVPGVVQVALQGKLHDQYPVGITGRIGAGKSYVAQKLVEVYRSYGIEAHHLNVDSLIRELYREQTTGAQQVRDTLADWFGPEVLKPLGGDALPPLVPEFEVDRVALKEKIGQAPEETLQKLLNLTRPHVNRLMREWLKTRTGIILLEWARLVEDGMSSLVNHNVVVVDSPDRDSYLNERGVSPEMAKGFESQQMTPTQMEKELKALVALHGLGHVIRYCNKRDQGVDELARQLLKCVQAGTNAS